MDLKQIVYTQICKFNYKKIYSKVIKTEVISFGIFDTLISKCIESDFENMKGVSEKKKETLKKLEIRWEFLLWTYNYKTIFTSNLRALYIWCKY